MDKYMPTMDLCEGNSLLDLLKKQTEQGGHTDKEWKIMESTNLKASDLPKKRDASKQSDSKVE
jgi:hypothetical protein